MEAKKKKMKIMNLALKSIYFEQIRKGVKKSEYRDFTDYYVDKLVDKSHYKGMDNERIMQHLRDGHKLYYQPYTHIHFHCGAKSMMVEVVDMVVERGYSKFVIHLGDVTEVE